MLIPVGLLLVIGLGAILSASSVIAIREGVDSLFYFKRQLHLDGRSGLLALVGCRRSPRCGCFARLAFPAFVLLGDPADRHPAGRAPGRMERPAG